MSVLMIGEAERAQIADVIADALAHPVQATSDSVTDYRQVLELKDRNPKLIRPPSAHVLLPVGYRAAYSVEAQPVGLCSHLSVSVEGRATKGMMPSVEAVQMIAEEFGVPYPPGLGWIEEFEPGEYAINLVSPL